MAKNIILVWYISWKVEEGDKIEGKYMDIPDGEKQVKIIKSHFIFER